MVVLHAGDAQLVAYDVQRTSPAIHIQKESGEIYYVSLVPVDGDIIDMSETLVYEENTINTCQSVNLSAGFYRVEMRGGAGGKPYACRSGTGLQSFLSDIVSVYFKISQETRVYSFRGGDGVISPAHTRQQISGGGASGVDSMLVVNNDVIRATGAPGTRCLSSIIVTRPDGAFGTSSCTGGGGGIYSDVSINDGRKAHMAHSAAFCAAGGGGANDSGGGAGGDDDDVANMGAGENGNASGGGNGGDAINPNGTGETSNRGLGGVGGKNVYFSCGGQVAVSYGGGGGGGACVYRIDDSCAQSSAVWCLTDCFNGGDGGSGSTGTSDTSFLRIYKVG